MGGKPSWLRPLAIACNVAATQGKESSYWDPEQLWRKFGLGGDVGGQDPRRVDDGGRDGGGRRAGRNGRRGAGAWATVVGGLTGTVVVGAAVPAWLGPGSWPV